jgi:hypothetical protein
MVGSIHSPKLLATVAAAALVAMVSAMPAIISSVR